MTHQTVSMLLNVDNNRHAKELRDDAIDIKHDRENYTSELDDSERVFDEEIKLVIMMSILIKFLNYDTLIAIMKSLPIMMTQMIEGIFKLLLLQW